MGLPVELHGYCGEISVPTSRPHSIQVTLLTARSPEAILNGNILFLSSGGPGLQARNGLFESYPRVDYQNTTVIAWDGVTNSDRSGACGPESTRFGIEKPSSITSPVIQTVAKECIDTFPEVSRGDDVGAAAAASELEALRDNLGLPQVNLLAYSYGTEIATDYARQFPDRVGRMVLDGPITGNAPYSARIAAVQDAVTAGFSDLARWCVPRRCPKSAVPLLSKARSWSGLRQQILDSQPKVGSGKTQLQPTVLDNALLFALARPQLRLTFARNIVSALAGDGTDMYEMGIKPYYGLDRSVYYRTVCKDVNGPPIDLNVMALPPLMQAYAWDLAPCTSVQPSGKRPDNPEQLELSQSLHGRVMVVASTLDPLTPWGLASAGELATLAQMCRVTVPGHTTAGVPAAQRAELRFLFSKSSTCPN